MAETLCVVLSTYNGERYLESQIDSLENQTLVPNRIHIRDDGSSDATSKIIQQLASKYGNITYELGCNIGWRKSFIAAVESCDGFDWYSFCDQDDIWLQDKLESAIRALGSFDRDLPLLYAGNAEIVDEELNPKGLFNNSNIDVMGKDCPHLLTKDEMAGGLTYVFNDVARQLLVSFDPRGLTGHDRVLLLICRLFGIVVYDQQPKVLYRQHGDNAIGYVQEGKNTVALFKKIGHLFRDGGRYRSEIAEGLLSLKTQYDLACSEEDISFLKQVAMYKNTFASWAKMLLSKNLGSYSFGQDLYFRIRIILRTY